MEFTPGTMHTSKIFTKYKYSIKTNPEKATQWDEDSVQRWMQSNTRHRYFMIITSVNHSVENWRWFPGKERKCMRPAWSNVFKPSRS